jgi:MSHA biogenesis protein MshN
MSLINKMLRDLDQRQRRRSVSLDGVLANLVPADVLPREVKVHPALPWVLSAALFSTLLLWHRDAIIDIGMTRSAPFRAVASAPAPTGAAVVVTQSDIAPAPPASAVAAPLDVTPPAPTVAAMPATTTTPPAPAALTATPSPTPPQAVVEAINAPSAAPPPEPATDSDTPRRLFEPAAPPVALDADSELVENLGTMHISRAPPSRSDDQASAIQQAEQAFVRGDTAVGLALLKAAVSRFQGSEKLNLAYARHLLQAGRSGEAETALREGLKQAPRAAALAQMLAHLRYDAGDSAGALAVLTRSAPPVAQALEYHEFLAALQQRQGEHAAAVATYREVLQAAPSHGNAWMGLAISLAALDARREAVAAFSQARSSGTLSQTMDSYAAAEIVRLQASP